MDLNSTSRFQNNIAVKTEKNRNCLLVCFFASFFILLYLGDMNQINMSWFDPSVVMQHGV